MKVIDINAMLQSNEEELIAFFKARSDSFWDLELDQKWKAGQHVIHLIQSARPLYKAITFYPSSLLKWQFGSNNREPRNFDEVVHRYIEKLEASTGAVSPFSRRMPEGKDAEQGQVIKQFSALNARLMRSSARIKEKDLDVVLLPHPLMGRMTLREILMWNAYHVKHHLNILKLKYLPLEDDLPE